MNRSQEGVARTPSQKLMDGQLPPLPGASPISAILEGSNDSGGMLSQKDVSSTPQRPVNSTTNGDPVSFNREVLSTVLAKASSMDLPMDDCVKVMDIPLSDHIDGPKPADYEQTIGTLRTRKRRESVPDARLPGASSHMENPNPHGTISRRRSINTFMGGAKAQATSSSGPGTVSKHSDGSQASAHSFGSNFSQTFPKREEAGAGFKFPTLLDTFESKNVPLKKVSLELQDDEMVLVSECWSKLQKHEGAALSWAKSTFRYMLADGRFDGHFTLSEEDRAQKFVHAVDRVIQAHVPDSRGRKNLVQEVVAILLEIGYRHATRMNLTVDDYRGKLAAT
ncbi:hypothetical protein HDU93_001191 [Gonapodya sp. JEL0774]|nr:hypothetical protein HDU93_001191 [Gonapodya sp. JEL0774]